MIASTKAHKGTPAAKATGNRKPRLALQPNQPNCYGYYVAFTDDFNPTSLVELPPPSVMHADDKHYDYAASEHLLMSRNAAFAHVAEMNAGALSRDCAAKGRPQWWHFVIKLVPPGEEWNCEVTLCGNRGVLSCIELDFEVVEPTKDEIEVYSIQATKGGAA